MASQKMSCAVITLVALAGFACAAERPRLFSFQQVDYGPLIGGLVRSPRSRSNVYSAELSSAVRGGPAFVLLHPWATNSTIWEDLGPRLTSIGRVVLIDLPGHGKSSKNPGRYPVRRLALAVLDVLDANRIGGAIIIGNSLGGATALELGRIAPRRCRALVLIGAPGGEVYPQLIQMGLRGIVSERNWATLSDEAFSFGWWFLHARGGTSPIGARIRDDLIALKGSPEWLPFVRATRSALLEVAAHEAPLEKITPPTLVVQGSADRVVLPSQGRALAQRLPDAELSVLEGCGHFPQLECQAELFSALTRFLSSRGLAQAVRPSAE